MTTKVFVGDRYYESTSDGTGEERFVVEERCPRPDNAGEVVVAVLRKVKVTATSGERATFTGTYATNGRTVPVSGFVTVKDGFVDTLSLQLGSPARIWTFTAIGKAPAVSAPVNVESGGNRTC